MRTSSTQFEMMVTYMEQHGDLSKPCSNARGRINMLKKWEELVQLLNSDGGGDSKTLEKWKKVWSDFKNNTKKKAARLHRAVVGTGGGPANLAKLSNLEQRLLRLVGLQVATGLAVEEAGLTQASLNVQPPQSQIEPIQMTIDVELCPQDEPGVSSPLQPPSQRRAVSSPPLTFVEEDVHIFQPWNEPGPSTAHHVAPPPTPPQARSPLNSFVEQQVEDQLTPTRPCPTSPVRVVRPEPALSGQTTPRRVRTRTRAASQRRVGPTPAHTEQAAQHFLQADEYWRKFKLQQHRDYMDLRREQIRIRELEVQATMGWQAMGSRMLESLEKIVNKYCKD